MWAVCYPAVSLIVGLILTVVWILRSLLKAAGKLLFYIQRLAGGAPEAVDVNYIGPATGKIPETSELRQFKPSGSSERMVAVKRNGDFWDHLNQYLKASNQYIQSISNQYL